MQHFNNLCPTNQDTVVERFTRMLMEERALTPSERMQRIQKKIRDLCDAKRRGRG
jgi:hypothetical protein